MESGTIEWRKSDGLVPYESALADMESRAVAIREGEADERVWLLEHPPLFTAGTSADPSELFNPLGFPVFEAGRGGRYTYHGPGQRVVYLNLDLDRRGRDIRRFVHALEGWMIAALADVGVAARREEGRIGIWTGDRKFRTAKGAAGTAEGDTGTQQFVFRVTEVTIPAFDAKSAQAKALDTSLQNSYADDITGEYIARLENDYGVKINQAALNQVVGGSTE